MKTIRRRFQLNPETLRVHRPTDLPLAGAGAPPPTSNDYSKQC
jgi:hypothetical protein